MKKQLTNLIIILLIFSIVFFVTAFSFMSIQDSYTKQIGMSKNLGLPITYLSILGVTIACFRYFKQRLGFKTIIATIIATLLIFTLLSSIGPSVKFAMKTLPYYPVWLMAFAAAIFSFTKNKNRFRLALILGIFPLALSFGPYENWVHWVNYGNLSGKVWENKKLEFEFEDQYGNTINRESFSNKLIMLNFISIRCKPCWVEFPEVQKTHKLYQSNELVEIYSVASLSTPDTLLNRIPEKGYSFPVLRTKTEVLELFQIDVYPTVIILNKDGKIVFKGNLENAKRELKSLLE
ncbi:MAG: TlpA disulfide reductase family protein [Cyclobacteriaceae bacterium]